MMDLFLDEYARSLPKDVLVVLVLDGAGWHTTGKLKVPQNLRLAVLPAYSPELNPAERLWHLQREATSNRAFKDMDELEDVLCGRCVELSKNKEMIRSATNYEGYRLPPTFTPVIQV